MTEHSPSIEPAPDPERYSLLRPLGSGASGSVYLAHDAETGGHVALKKLFRLDQKSVQRFKREFRALTDLHHPNLVKLFDLQRGSDAWFLTMEYVDGVELRAHSLAPPSEALITRDALVITRDLRVANDVGTDPAVLDEKLRVFHELANGVQALHRAGLLHRDLKPSNVIIARDGRVVVLDFGLIRPLDGSANQMTQDGTVAGTPAYMPPEQALGETLSEASDWYAYGVMLYEALAGHLPIDDRNAASLLQRKLRHDPEPLSHEYLDVPRELTELCMQLLQRAPERRATGKQILDVLATLRGEQPAPERTLTEELSLLADVAAPQKRRALIGRDRALSQPMAALTQARQGSNVAVSVRGSSGSGKTALIEHCLNEVENSEFADGPSPLVLRSRCYERESMPFKALDGAMDALVHFLSKQDDLRVAHLLPSGLPELTQLFPTFQRLRSVQRLLLNKQPHPDAAHTRQRAEQSLRELIDRVAAQRPVVLWIDDVQWGDLDSTSVLRDWFAKPAASPLTMILSYRSEELETSACLRALGLPVLDAQADADRTLIELEALAEVEVKALCAQRLPDASQEVVTRIVAEARGNPFWVLQLSALAQAKLGRGELELDDISIGELVMRTSALLPAGARAILEVLAIAGRPLVPHLALRAAEVEQDGRALIHELQGLRLLRSRVVNGERHLEIYHDRVREAVQAALDAPARQRVHDRLLRAMEISGRADSDWLHELALGAGEPALALRFGLLAAERAHKTLAFERAIDLYQRCLRLTESKSEQAQLWRKLAAALAQSRRGAEAADAYLQAAERVEPSQQLPLLQLAASHLLRTGRFEEGEQLVQRVLEAQGIEVPQTEAGLYAAIAWERTRLALRGTNFEPKPPEEISREGIRIAVLYGILSVETQFYAPLRSALFQSRAMRMGLQIGDPGMVARALCLTAAVSCLAGTERAAQRANEQLARAEALSTGLENQDLRSELFSARTVCAFLLGAMTDVLTAADMADRIHDTQRTGGEQGDYYYLFAVDAARIGALQVLGHHKEADQKLHEFLVRANATANRTAVLQATLVRAVSEQVLDRVAESKPRLDAEREELPKLGIGILHLLHLAAVIRSATASSEFDWAFDVIDRYWDRCLKSPLRHGRVLRYILHSSRARLLLNQYVAQGRKGDPAAVVREDMNALKSMSFLRIREPARSFEARIAYLRGDFSKARDLIRASAQDFKSLGLFEEAARETHALGYMIAGEEGARLRASAHQASLALGVVNPLLLLHGSYPELAIDAEL